MRRRRRLAARVAFFVLLLGGAVMAGFYNSGEHAQSGRQTNMVAPAKPVSVIRFVNCSEAAGRARYQAQCRRANEYLRESMKRLERGQESP